MSRMYAARAALALLFAGLTCRVDAAVTVQTSLASQVPQLAQAGTAYSWVIAPDTFVDSTGASQSSSFQYTADGLPSWCTFDASSRTFSGSPQAADVGRRWITLTAADSGSSDSDGFMLNVVDTPPVTVHKPLASQLPTASTLSPGNLLPNGAQHIPLGWSFSIGFAADTFQTADNAQIYLAARLASGDPLPGWLQYDPSTNTMWGVAPTTPGPEGATFDVTIFASRIPGYSDARNTFTLVVSSHALTLSQPLPLVNVTVNEAFQFSIPTSGLQLDGRPSPPTNNIQATVDLAKLPWLTYNAANRSIIGTPPASILPSNVSDMATVQVPVVFSDGFDNDVPTNLTLNVYPSLFAAAKLSTIFVQPGVAFQQSLGSQIRTPRNSSAPVITASFIPANASQWLAFNQSTYTLSGTPPKNPDDARVRVALQANASSTTGIIYRSTSSLNIAVQGDKVTDSPDAGPTGTTGTSGTSDGNSGQGQGISARTKLILGATFGAIGGLLLLILLVVCCRRCVAVEEHDAKGREKYHDDDDATLNGNSPMFPKTFLHPGKDEKRHYSPGPGTPSTLVASPLPGHTAIKFAEGEAAPPSEQGSDGVQRSNSGNESPAKHVFFKSILKKSKSKQQLPISRPTLIERSDSPSNGLGLALNGEDSGETGTENPYGHAPSKSIRTIGSRKASWETDIFHESPLDAPQTGASTPKSVASKDETPIRRGPPPRQFLDGGVVRQRGAHSGASPAFTTSQRFEMQTQEEEELEEADLADAEVRQVSHVQLRSVLTRQPSVSEAIRDTSHSVQMDHEEGAFDDAEDEQTSEEAKRISTMSYLINRNGLDGVDRAIIYDDQPQAVLSPAQGSTFGAASFVSGHMAPEETLRAIDSQPFSPVPPASASSHAHTRSIGIEDQIQHGLGHPGEMLRVKLRLRQPPPLQGGAPGSPGKRSGRKTEHLPLLDDPSSTEHLTLPDWLCWLSWDARLCELSGMVPADLTTACKIPIVVIARTQDPIPGGESGQIAGFDDEVAARCELELRPKDWVMPDQY